MKKSKVVKKLFVMKREQSTFVRDNQELERKLEQLKQGFFFSFTSFLYLKYLTHSLWREGGASKLQVVSDFDRTITLPSARTAWEILVKSERMSERFRKTSDELLSLFHPAEVDRSLPLAHRVAQMEEWWKRAHDNLVRERLHKEVFRLMVEEQKSEIIVRKRFEDFLERLKESRIPILLFSAGLGDVMEAVANSLGWKKHKQLHIVSNFVEFDSEGYSVRFNDNLIHIFNKNQVNLLSTPYREELINRPNVILLGDSEGDEKMSDGIEHGEKYENTKSFHFFHHFFFGGNIKKKKRLCFEDWISE